MENAKHELVIGTIPETLDDFVSLRDRIAETSAGGAAVTVVGLLLYARDSEGALGRQALTLTLDRSRLRPSGTAMLGWDLRPIDDQRLEMRISGRPWMLRSYFKGTTPDEGYRLPAPPLVITVLPDRLTTNKEADLRKVFVVCSGADSPRPVTVKRNTSGIWKAWEWSSLTVGVKAPADDAGIDDTL
jgi:hypothetical protein